MGSVEYRHESMRMSYVKGEDSSFKMMRFEPCDYHSMIQRQTAFEPFVIKTAESTASPMEGCGSFPSVWDGAPCEMVENNEKGLTLKYLKRNGTMEITVRLDFIEGANVIRQTNTVKNISKNPITLTHFSSGLICGIGMGGKLNRWDDCKIKVHYCLSHWCGEAQWREASLEDVGIYKQSMHNWDMSSYRISSTGTWSTGKYYPLMMVEDLECGEIWYLEHEGASNWTMELGCLNDCGEVKHKAVGAVKPRKDLEKP